MPVGWRPPGNDREGKTRRKVKDREKSLNRVKEAYQKFQILGDQTVAHVLQEREVEEHLAANKLKAWQVRTNLRVARRLQEEEDERSGALDRKPRKQTKNIRDDKLVFKEKVEVWEESRQRSRKEQKDRIRRSPGETDPPSEDREEARDKERRDKASPWYEICYGQPRSRQPFVVRELEEGASSLEGESEREGGRYWFRAGLAAGREYAAIGSGLPRVIGRTAKESPAPHEDCGKQTAKLSDSPEDEGPLTSTWKPGKRSRAQPRAAEGTQRPASRGRRGARRLSPPVAGGSRLGGRVNSPGAAPFSGHLVASSPERFADALERHAFHSSMSDSELRPRRRRHIGRHHHPLDVNQEYTSHPLAVDQKHTHLPLGVNQMQAHHPLAVDQNHTGHPLAVDQKHTHHPLGVKQMQSHYPLAVDQKHARHPLPVDQKHAQHPLAVDQKHAHHPLAVDQKHTRHPLAVDQKHARHPLAVDQKHARHPLTVDQKHIHWPLAVSDSQTPHRLAPNHNQSQYPLTVDQNRAHCPLTVMAKGAPSLPHTRPKGKQVHFLLASSEQSSPTQSHLVNKQKQIPFPLDSKGKEVKSSLVGKQRQVYFPLAVGRKKEFLHHPTPVKENDVQYPLDTRPVASPLAVEQKPIQYQLDFKDTEAIIDYVLDKRKDRVSSSLKHSFGLLPTHQKMLSGQSRGGPAETADKTQLLVFEPAVQPACWHAEKDPGRSGGGRLCDGPSGHGDDSRWSEGAPRMAEGRPETRDRTRVLSSSRRGQDQQRAQDKVSRRRTARRRVGHDRPRSPDPGDPLPAESSREPASSKVRGWSGPSNSSWFSDESLKTQQALELRKARLRKASTNEKQFQLAQDEAFALDLLRQEMAAASLAGAQEQSDLVQADEGFLARRCMQSPGSDSPSSVNVDWDEEPKASKSAYF
ncbi:uncharacterized protein [Narcine bancroftii]|uniref:uncharacterized protein isoform X2 n=1 Tax=Narcine bancroftii TaxID=1343680 RepID=UPI0038320458